jgi:hypothetical protein
MFLFVFIRDLGRIKLNNEYKMFNTEFEPYYLINFNYQYYYHCCKHYCHFTVRKTQNKPRLAQGSTYCLPTFAVQV